MIQQLLCLPPLVAMAILAVACMLIFSILYVFTYWFMLSIGEHKEKKKNRNSGGNSGAIFDKPVKKVTAIKLPVKRIRAYIPPSVSSDRYEQYIMEALEYYQGHEGEIE